MAYNDAGNTEKCVYIDNAGVMNVPCHITEDNLESQFQIVRCIYGSIHANPH